MDWIASASQELTMSMAFTIVGIVVTISYTIISLIRYKNPEISIMKDRVSALCERMSAVEEKSNALHAYYEHIQNDLQTIDERMHRSIHGVENKIEKVSDLVVEVIKESKFRD